MINFIGTGSAFNTELGNNSAYVKLENQLLLIDCGGTVFHEIKKKNLLSNIDKLNIIITHTHPDHCGSLGEIIFYMYYIVKKPVNIYYPNKEIMETLLKIIGVTKDMCNYNSSKEIITDKFTIDFNKTSHTDTVDAYNFILEVNNYKLYYSGDSNNISEEVIDRLQSGNIDRIYQDTCGLDYDNNAHLSLRKLTELIPKEFRKNVYCMHLDTHINIEDIKERGFNVAEVKK